MDCVVRGRVDVFEGSLSANDCLLEVTISLTILHSVQTNDNNHYRVNGKKNSNPQGSQLVDVTVPIQSILAFLSEQEQVIQSNMHFLPSQLLLLG